MTGVSASALGAVELGVPDLDASVRFYTDVWGLTVVRRDGAVCYLRAAGPDHYVLALHRRDAPGLVRTRLNAANRRDADALAAQAASAGARIVRAPGAIDLPGGGYGFAMLDPDGREFVITCETQGHTEQPDVMDRPHRLSHVVFNSFDFDGAAAFMTKALGFRLRDRTRKANFMGCNADHHCIAFTDRKNAAISHVAYELPGLDGVMRGCGRLKKAGLALEWGVGRHGTGENVFAYFVDPNGFAIEYTADMQQVDDATYVPGTPDTISRPNHADLFGLSEPPSRRFLEAVNGPAARGGG